MTLTLDMFPEIVVAGILFTAAVSPILYHFGLLQRLEGRKDWKEWIFIIVPLIYALGIAGNRLCEAAVKDTPLDPNERPARAEIVLREHSPEAREWVERHKTYLKVERAGAVASIVLGICLLVYPFGKERRHLAGDQRRPTRLQALAALLGVVFFLAAYWYEVRHYKNGLDKYCQVIGKVAECTGHGSTPPGVPAKLETQRRISLESAKIELVMSGQPGSLGQDAGSSAR